MQVMQPVLALGLHALDVFLPWSFGMGEWLKEPVYTKLRVAPAIWVVACTYGCERAGQKNRKEISRGSQ